MPHRIDVVATCLEAIENACRFKAAQSELQSIKAPYVIACLMKEVRTPTFEGDSRSMWPGTLMACDCPTRLCNTLPLSPVCPYNPLSQKELVAVARTIAFHLLRC